MKDWFTVEPDKFALVGSHRYTAGRGGKSIQYVTRHHIMGNMTTEQVRNLWQYDREASAHYVVENSGLIGQIVYDRNTAWSNGNAASNRVSVSIEHANNTGRYNGNDYHDKSWNISETVIREGAKLGAALCWYYKLGRPVLGKNIRDHNEFTATGCPVHLKRGGKYSDQWMRIAQEHYDWMVREKAGKNTPKPTPKEDDMAEGLETLIEVANGDKHPAKNLIKWTDERVYELTREGGTLDEMSKTQQRIEGKLDQLLSDKEEK